MKCWHPNLWLLDDPAERLVIPLRVVSVLCAGGAAKGDQVLVVSRGGEEVMHRSSGHAVTVSEHPSKHLVFSSMLEHLVP